MTINDYDSDLARSGQQEIDWVRRSMPVLASIEARLTTSGAIKGKRIGISLVLEPKTANLVLALRNAGAEVSVWAPADCVQADVVHALLAEGIKLFANVDASEEEDINAARAFLATAPQILVDDGARAVRLAHLEFPDVVKNMIGAAEQTTSGVRTLNVMADASELHIPVVNVSDSRLKFLFDNVYGTGQSCVMAMLDVTNLQIAGREILVIGYGWVGKGVALHATALGARVTVAELDPIKALQALHDGHKVKSIMDAAPTTAVVFASTGIEGVITPAHLQAMADQVILCTAGGGSYEMPMEFLRSLENQKEIRAEVMEYTLPGGKRVLLISDGHCINCTAGEGNPIEIMDLSMSLQASAIEALALNAASLTNGIHPIPEEIENAIAIERLTGAGASIEPMTPELADAPRRRTRTTTHQDEEKTRW